MHCQYIRFLAGEYELGLHHSARATLATMLTLRCSSDRSIGVSAPPIAFTRVHSLGGRWLQIDNLILGSPAVRQFGRTKPDNHMRCRAGARFQDEGCRALGCNLFTQSLLDTNLA